MPTLDFFRNFPTLSTFFVLFSNSTKYFFHFFHFLISFVNLGNFSHFILPTLSCLPAQLVAHIASENSVYQLDGKETDTIAHISAVTRINQFHFLHKSSFSSPVAGRRMCADTRMNGEHLRKDELRMLHHLFTVLFRSLPLTFTLAAHIRTSSLTKS